MDSCTRVVPVRQRNPHVPAKCFYDTGDPIKLQSSEGPWRDTADPIPGRTLKGVMANAPERTIGARRWSANGLSGRAKPVLRLEKRASVHALGVTRCRVDSNVAEVVGRCPPARGFQQCQDSIPVDGRWGHFTPHMEYSVAASQHRANCIMLILLNLFQQSSLVRDRS